MSYKNIPFKSYCWNLGTTSFRTKQLNQKIEIQLNLLDEFLGKPENRRTKWTSNNELQAKYYNFLKEKRFTVGDETRLDKAAREKTSGLCELGLIDENRRLTNVGLRLLEISKKGDFGNNNILQLPNDSFLFTKQLIKLSNKQVEENVVRPYLVLVFLLNRLNYLTNDEFAYLLPLCVNKETTLKIANQIILFRNNEINIDTIITDNVLKSPNYVEAKQLLLDNEISEELICTIGMNRKSRQYDKAYYPFYKYLKLVCVDKKFSEIICLYNATKQIKIGKYWRALLFKSTSLNLLKSKPEACLSNHFIYSVENEIEFKKMFFDYLHLFKIKANLLDYSDLNLRYFKTTDTILSNDGIIKLDVIPKYFFEGIADQLFEEAFTDSEDLLYDNVDLERIFPSLKIDSQVLYSKINKELGIKISNEGDIKSLVAVERHSRFINLIKNKFGNDTLTKLLTYFESRENDDEILKLVTENADVPTIFEYILGIIWFKISDYTGDILDYMNLSLDADLLPKSHASGGEADIVYKYKKTKDYPEHDMLIEATLMDESAQRRGEMEPVSRHLGNHILDNGNTDSYCTFISPYLDINVLNHFRGLKHNGYYNPRDYSQHVEKLKIIALKTNELKTILKKNIKYSQLYKIFDEAYRSDIPLTQWYNDEIISKL